MPSILDMQSTIIEHLQAGELVKGMEDCHADDVINEEVTGAKVQGKQTIIDNEKRFLETVANFHGITVHSTGGNETSPGSGTTFMEYSIRVDLKDGKSLYPDQVQVTRWENGKVKHIKFLYDPAQL